MCKWFCKHKWKKESEIVFPSGAEQLGLEGRVTKIRGESNLFDKSAMVIMSCEKCGKIKKFKMHG